ncbi:hypothetical protein GCM10029992_20340 [Glycomyces albus]
MTDSAPLAAAHHQNRSRRQTAIDREAGLALAMWIRLARWLLALVRSLNSGAAAKPEPHPTQAGGAALPQPGAPVARIAASRPARQFR